jgi:hypothetical protein
MIRIIDALDLAAFRFGVNCRQQGAATDKQKIPAQTQCEQRYQKIDQALLQSGHQQRDARLP